MAKKLDEIAAGGSTGGGSIAAVPSRMGGMQSRLSLKDFMDKFYSNIQNRSYYKPVKIDKQGSIKEMFTESANFQLTDLVPKLRNAETQSDYSNNNSVSFGVEDDAENIMIVSVPVEQGENFEVAVARALADVVQYKQTGRGEDKTLAELLYDLKDDFTIIDVKFPKIPRDAVYHADQIDSISEDEEGEENTDDIGDGADDTEGEETDEIPEDDLESPEGEEEDTEDETDLEDLPEDESVSDFEAGDDESLLRSVLSMLKTQNEKEIAQAQAESEKAKAMQAELEYKQAKERAEADEEIVTAEAEMDAEKEREKEADRLADIAKFRFQQKQKNEGFSDIFKSVLVESISDMDTERTVRNELRTIKQKWQPDPDDTPETRAYKQKQLQNALRMNRVKQKAVQDRQRFKRDQNQDDQEQQDRERDQDQENQRNQQGQEDEI